MDLPTLGSFVASCEGGGPVGAMVGVELRVGVRIGTGIGTGSRRRHVALGLFV